MLGRQVGHTQIIRSVIVTGATATCVKRGLTGGDVALRVCGVWRVLGGEPFDHDGDVLGQEFGHNRHHLPLVIMARTGQKGADLRVDIGRVLPREVGEFRIGRDAEQPVTQGAAFIGRIGGRVEIGPRRDAGCGP